MHATQKRKRGSFHTQTGLLISSGSVEKENGNKLKKKVVSISHTIFYYLLKWLYSAWPWLELNSVLRHAMAAEVSGQNVWTGWENVHHADCSIKTVQVHTGEVRGVASLGRGGCGWCVLIVCVCARVPVCVCVSNVFVCKMSARVRVCEMSVRVSVLACAVCTRAVWVGGWVGGATCVCT